MSKNKSRIDIKGMHCRSCEIVLEQNIGEVAGISKVRVDHVKGWAEIEYAGALDLEAVERAVLASGYSIGKEDAKHFLSRNPGDYWELLVVGSIVAMAYLLLEDFGLFSMNPGVNPAAGLFGPLLIGLTAGISTCMALIGGLVLGISSRHAERHPEASPAQKFRPHLFFNAGRLASYIVFGGLIGALGSALKLSSPVLGVITMALGAVMLFLGLKLIEIFPRLHNKSLTLPKGLSKALGLQREGEYSHRGAFITGALTFFVPCGFTQSMQLYAVSTGSFAQGALIMGLFALGTLPGIIGIGGLASSVKGAFARFFFKFAGVVVVALAVFNISSGYALSGISLGIGDGSSSDAAQVQMVDGKQVVEMVQEVDGYSPRQMMVKRGIPVVWKITSKSQYTCAAYINMPAAGISEPLSLGENVIEFTPTKAGTMKFTCSMGMFTGSFNVVD